MSIQMSNGVLGPSHPSRWFPEFLEIGRRRLRSQGRVLAASMLVGVVAGLGGIVFSAAGQFVAELTMEGIAGYRPVVPALEVLFPNFPTFHMPFNPWLLILVQTIGGLISGWIVFRFAPEA